MIVRQLLGARVASISSSVASVANKGVVTSIVNDTADTLDTRRRCFYSTTTNNSSSMIPTHMSPLVLVKSIRVPRPIKPKHKVRNKLKDRIELDTKSKVVKVDEKDVQHLSYVGNVQIPITSKLEVVLPEEDVPNGIWPVFRMMVS